MPIVPAPTTTWLSTKSCWTTSIQFLILRTDTPNWQAASRIPESTWVMFMNKSGCPRSRRSWQLWLPQEVCSVIPDCVKTCLEALESSSDLWSNCSKEFRWRLISGWHLVHGPYWGVTCQPDHSAGATTDSRSDSVARQMWVSATFLHLSGTSPRCGWNSSYQWEGARDCGHTSATRRQWVVNLPRKFLHNLSAKLAPLRHLQMKDVTWSWGPGVVWMARD